MEVDPGDRVRLTQSHDENLVTQEGSQGHTYLD